jgi:hypothetical protein
MDTRATEGTGADGSSGVKELSAARVFGSDVVMTLAVINEARYILLRHYFGVSRQQVNVLTVALVLTSADAAYLTMRRVLHEPVRVTAADVTMGGLVLREAGYAIAGPAARNVPFFGALVTAALVGKFAVPSVRGAIHRLRRTEQRIREQQLRIYNTARRVDR